MKLRSITMAATLVAIMVSIYLTPAGASVEPNSARFLWENPGDSSWTLVGGPDAPFAFEATLTNYDVIETGYTEAAGGGTWHYLAAQYLAAEVNGLSGVPYSGDISIAIAEAANLLSSHGPYDGLDRRTERKFFTWADRLYSFNCPVGICPR